VGITIIPDFLPDNHPLTMLPMVPEYITIHSTANTSRGANAAMHGRYMRSAEAIAREVMWHFTVDDREIRQHLPLDRNGWHAGDGWNGPGNRKSIGIEICENADGDLDAAIANAAKLVTRLIKTVPSLRPFPECVVQHNRWSGKDCPRILRHRPGGWEGFIGMVKHYLEEMERMQERKKVLIVDAAGNLLAEGWLEGSETVAKVRPLLEAMGKVVDWRQEGEVRKVIVRFPGAK